MRVTAVLSTVMILLLVACGGGEDDATLAPTVFVPTATPRSTPLPPVALTPIAFGSADVPLRVLYITDADDDDVADAVLNVETALNTDLTNERLAALDLEMTIELERSTDVSTMLDAVCLQRDVLAWVDAFSYAVAAERCDAMPLFGVERSVTIDGLPDDVSADTTEGIAFDIVYAASTDPAPTGVSDLAGATVCRLGVSDPISWVYFSLALRAADVNPITDLAGVVDVEDYAAILAGINDGICTVGAIPEGTLADIAEETTGIDEDDFAMLRSSWPTIPHAILIAPPSGSIEADLIESFSTQLTTLLEDETFSEGLAVLVPHDQIVPVRALDFRTFIRWLDDAGWAMGR